MNMWDDAGKMYVIPEDGKPETAAKLIRDRLIRNGDIGKFTPVTVELVSAGAVNVYREVWA
jgi:hypothetical protein